MSEMQPGASDEAVLSACVSTGRTLLTFDKDFGELAYRRGLPAECGVVLFRVVAQNPEEISDIALRAIRSQPTWAGRFSVVTRQRIRMRPLPPARST